MFFLNLKKVSTKNTQPVLVSVCNMNEMQNINSKNEELPPLLDEDDSWIVIPRGCPLFKVHLQARTGVSVSFTRCLCLKSVLLLRLNSSFLILQHLSSTQGKSCTKGGGEKNRLTNKVSTTRPVKWSRSSRCPEHGIISRSICRTCRQSRLPYRETYLLRYQLGRPLAFLPPCAIKCPEDWRTGMNAVAVANPANGESLSTCRQ